MITFESATKQGLAVTVEAEFQPPEVGSGIGGGWMVVKVLCAGALVLDRWEAERYLGWREVDRLDEEAGTYARMQEEDEYVFAHGGGDREDD